MKPFTYAVGHRWNEDNEGSAVGCYTYGGQLCFGTMQDAEKWLEYVQKETSWSNHVWRIYKLVEVL